MNGKERREVLLELLKREKKPITGSDLSSKFAVSRQVIVQDIALLRARGESIMATSQGYLMAGKSGSRNSRTLTRTIACRHNREEVEDELMTMVNYGARIVDVIVEHPIYGELTGLLMIQSPEDVRGFMEKYHQEQTALLSSLTGGIHLHTVEVMNRQVEVRLKEKLREKGYLFEEED